MVGVRVLKAKVRGCGAVDGDGRSFTKQRLLCWRTDDSVCLRNCTAALLLS